MESRLTRQGSKLNALEPQRLDGLLHFSGVVKSDDGSFLQGAIVALFASLADGDENPLGYTCTDMSGHYFFSIQRPNDTQLSGFKLRACKNDLMPEITAFADKYLAEAAESFEQSDVQPELELEPEQLQVKPIELKKALKPKKTKQIYDNAVCPGDFLPPVLDNTLTDRSIGSVAYLRGGEIWVTVFGRT